MGIFSMLVAFMLTPEGLDGYVGVNGASWMGMDNSIVVPHMLPR